MAVTANQPISSQKERDLTKGEVLTAKTLYQGTLAFYNRTSGAGEGYVTDVTNSGANNFAGVVREKVDNSAGANGAKEVELYKRGRFLLQGTGFAQYLEGEKAYASDNFTVTASSSSTTLIGTFVEYVDSTHIWVDVDPHPA